MPLREWQILASEEIRNCIHLNLTHEDYKNRKHGKILIAPTRSGKTYALSDALKKCQEMGLLNNPNKPCNILVITKDSVVYQTSRVFKEHGISSFFVTNYGSIRSTFGELWITWVKKFEYGLLAEKPIFDEELKPDIIILDEVQEIKNASTQCAHIIQAFLEQGGLVIAASATPFHTVDEARMVCMICGIVGFTTSAWKGFAYSISDEPKAINHAAMQRLNEVLENENAIIRFNNIKYLHRSFNKCVLIDFDNPKHERIYVNAYNEYLERIAKAGKLGPKGIAEIWVATLKYRQKTELLRTPRLARMTIDKINDDKQVIIGSNFVETLRATWINLVRRHAWPDDKISFVVGGQNKTERQRMIDKFQNGSNKICLFTLKSGGAGLSLHHDRESSLPREVILPPTWSGIELVQALGRAHGPTSLSTTRQEIIWYAGTVEEEVAARVANRLRSLSEIVGKRESWTDVFMNKNVEGLREFEGNIIEADARESLEGLDNVYDGIDNLDEPISK